MRSVVLGLTGRLSWLIGVAFWVTACQGRQSSLDPRGPAAAQIAELWWIMLVMGGLVFAVVLGLLWAALFRRRAAEVSGTPKSNQGHTWIVAGGIVMPIIVLIAVIIFTVETMRSIDTAHASDNLVIEVVGRQWWWEVHYPAQQVTTANEIHLPVGQAVTIKLTSRDVVHSLWIPKLHGKFDLTPGRIDTFVLQADKVGEYYGQCAEFCGVQHANMGLVVVGQASEDFADWLAQQAEASITPTDPLALTGQQVFLSGSCAECHTIQGTEANGNHGPDLTHLASRLTLASGIFPNTPDYLHDWIRNPQDLKPGALMPTPDLSETDLQALLAYLATLK